LISNYAFICNYLVFLFTRLYDLSNEISIIGGNSHRIGQLLEETEDNKEEVSDNRGEQQGPKAANLSDDVCLVTKNLTVMTPDKNKILIKNLNFTLEKNHKILITGKSGCGKTSLLRCISGLWKSYTGEINLNFDSMRPSNVFFLPQTPYFTNGSLLEQIIYPSNEVESKYTSDELNGFISAWLKKFNMTDVLEKVNWSATRKPNFNWPSILSLGKKLILNDFLD
jgi:ATP-binding cassette subfamily D (ALD) protein 4